MLFPLFCIIYFGFCTAKVSDTSVYITRLIFLNIFLHFLFNFKVFLFFLFLNFLVFFGEPTRLTHQLGWVEPGWYFYGSPEK